MTQTEKQEIGQSLGESETCPLCANTGQIACDAHMVEVDEDGWCLTCDSPDLSRIACYCQDK